MSGLLLHGDLTFDVAHNSTALRIRKSKRGRSYTAERLRYVIDQRSFIYYCYCCYYDYCYYYYKYYY